MISVSIPTPLRKLTKDASTVYVEGSTIRDILYNLEFGYPGIKERLLTPTNSLRTFINIYVNDEDIRFLDELDTPVKDTDVITILPAIAGG